MYNILTEFCIPIPTVGLVAQSVQLLTTGSTVRGLNPVAARFSARPDGPGAHPASYKMGTGSFPG